MRHIDALAALRGGAATIVAMSRQQKLLSVAQMFKAKGDKDYATVLDIEGVAPGKLKERGTIGTILEPVVRHLNEIGVPTEPNLAGVMASLEISQEELHDFACYCHHETMTGHMAHNLLARKAGAVEPASDYFDQLANSG